MLVNSLDEKQRKKAIFTDVAYSEIVTFHDSEVKTS